MCSHCYSGKAMNTTYCECVSIALGIQHEMRISLVVTCYLFGASIFFHIFS